MSKIPMEPTAEQVLAKEFVESAVNVLPNIFGLSGYSKDWVVDHKWLARSAKYAFDASLADNPGKTDYEALDASYEFAESRNPLLRVGLPLAPVQLLWNWSARWYEQGMPRVVWSDRKFPEMLMMSNADPSVIEHVRPPWRAFLVDLPKDLLFTRHPATGVPTALVHLAVHCVRTTDDTLIWNFIAHGADMIELWRHGLTAEHLIRTGNEYESKLYAGSVDDEDNRILILLGRLLIGLCLTLSDPSKVREAKATKSRTGWGKVKSDATPQPRNFVVEAVTTLKVQSALQDFVRNGEARKIRGAPSVRSLVRGHWKMQAHGPRHSLRKLIFLEPYWSPRDESLPSVTREFVIQSGPCTEPTPPS